MLFCCRQDNDLYRILSDAGHVYPRCDALEEALAEAPSGAGIEVNP